MTKKTTPARKHESATGALLWHHGESTTPQPPSAASVSARAILKSEMGGFGTDTQGRIPLEYALRAIEQALTQQRGEVLDRPARVGGRDFKAGELVQRVVGRAHAEYDRHHGGCLRHPYTGELRDYRDVESDPDGTLCVGHGPLSATTTQPSADAVRELVLLSRGLAKRTFNRSTAEMYIHFADKLESLLCQGNLPAQR